MNGWFMGFVINGNIAMRLLLFFLFVFNYSFVDGQNVYVPGEVAKGKTAAYRCKSWGKLMLEVSNVNNVDTIRTDDFSTIAGNNDEALRTVLREELSDEEWNSIKGKVGYGLTFNLVVNVQGEIHNLVFMFRTTDPVFTKLTPDRLYKLEQRFKETLIEIWGKSAKPVKNMVYIQGLDYRDLL